MIHSDTSYGFGISCVFNYDTPVILYRGLGLVQGFGDAGQFGHNRDVVGKLFQTLFADLGSG